MRQLARTYFRIWNTHDKGALAALFASNGTLTDWDQSVSGTEDIEGANAKIFSANPGAEITVGTCYLNGHKRSVACEISLILNNATKEVLKVVDVIEFTQDKKIQAIRAYKG
mmetsp:Transcript_15538/g.21455  ORF Transcript_15538/g.21455 Transcript_15538/m.21455 type:complete len:112 (+) Transcript_15538:329-664(+)